MKPTSNGKTTWIERINSKFSTTLRYNIVQRIIAGKNLIREKECNVFGHCIIV